MADDQLIFVCIQCGYGCASYEDLTEHMDDHEDQKPDMQQLNGKGKLNTRLRERNAKRGCNRKLKGVGDFKLENEHDRTSLFTYPSYISIGADSLDSLDTTWSRSTMHESETIDNDLSVPTMVITDSGLSSKPDNVKSNHANSSGNKKRKTTTSNPRSNLGRNVKKKKENAKKKKKIDAKVFRKRATNSMRLRRVAQDGEICHDYSSEMSDSDKLADVIRRSRIETTISKVKMAESEKRTRNSTRISILQKEDRSKIEKGKTQNGVQKSRKKKANTKVLSKAVIREIRKKRMSRNMEVNVNKVKKKKSESSIENLKRIPETSSKNIKSKQTLPTSASTLQSNPKKKRSISTSNRGSRTQLILKRGATSTPLTGKIIPIKGAMIWKLVNSNQQQNSNHINLPNIEQIKNNATLKFTDEQKVMITFNQSSENSKSSAVKTIIANVTSPSKSSSKISSGTKTHQAVLLPISSLGPSHDQKSGKQDTERQTAKLLRSAAKKTTQLSNYSIIPLSSFIPTTSGTISLSKAVSTAVTGSKETQNTMKLVNTERSILSSSKTVSRTVLSTSDTTSVIPLAMNINNSQASKQIITTITIPTTTTITTLQTSLKPATSNSVRQNDASNSTASTSQAANTSTHTTASQQSRMLIIKQASSGQQLLSILPSIQNGSQPIQTFQLIPHIAKNLLPKSQAPAPSNVVHPVIIAPRQKVPCPQAPSSIAVSPSTTSSNTRTLFLKPEDLNAAIKNSGSTIQLTLSPNKSLLPGTIPVVLTNQKQIQQNINITKQVQLAFATPPAQATTVTPMVTQIIRKPQTTLVSASKRPSVFPGIGKSLIITTSLSTASVQNITLVTAVTAVTSSLAPEQIISTPPVKLSSNLTQPAGVILKAPSSSDGEANAMKTQVPGTLAITTKTPTGVNTTEVNKSKDTYVTTQSKITTDALQSDLSSPADTVSTPLKTVVPSAFPSLLPLPNDPINKLLSTQSSTNNIAIQSQPSSVDSIQCLEGKNSFSVLSKTAEKPSTLICKIPLSILSKSKRSDYKSDINAVVWSTLDLGHSSIVQSNSRPIMSSGLSSTCRNPVLVQTSHASQPAAGSLIPLITKNAQNLTSTATTSMELIPTPVQPSCTNTLDIRPVSAQQSLLSSPLPQLAPFTSKVNVSAVTTPIVMSSMSNVSVVAMSSTANVSLSRERPERLPISIKLTSFASGDVIKRSKNLNTIAKSSTQNARISKTETSNIETTRIQQTPLLPKPTQSMVTLLSSTPLTSLSQPVKNMNSGQPFSMTYLTSVPIQIASQQNRSVSQFTGLPTIIQSPQRGIYPALPQAPTLRNNTGLTAQKMMIPLSLAVTNLKQIQSTSILLPSIYSIIPATSGNKVTVQPQTAKPIMISMTRPSNLSNNPVTKLQKIAAHPVLSTSSNTQTVKPMTTLSNLQPHGVHSTAKSSASAPTSVTTGTVTSTTCTTASSFPLTSLSDGSNRRVESSLRSSFVTSNCVTSITCVSSSIANNHPSPSPSSAVIQNRRSSTTTAVSSSSKKSSVVTSSNQAIDLANSLQSILRTDIKQGSTITINIQGNPTTYALKDGQIFEVPHDQPAKKEESDDNQSPEMNPPITSENATPLPVTTKVDVLSDKPGCLSFLSSLPGGYIVSTAPATTAIVTKYPTTTSNPVLKSLVATTSASPAGITRQPCSKLHISVPTSLLQKKPSRHRSCSGRSAAPTAGAPLLLKSHSVDELNRRSEASNSDIARLLPSEAKHSLFEPRGRIKSTDHENQTSICNNGNVLRSQPANKDQVFPRDPLPQMETARQKENGRHREVECQKETALHTSVGVLPKPIVSEPVLKMSPTIKQSRQVSDVNRKRKNSSELTFGFECDVCSAKFETYNAMWKHRKIHLNETFNASSPLGVQLPRAICPKFAVCKVCNNLYQNTSDLQRHMLLDNCHRKEADTQSWMETADKPRDSIALDRQLSFPQSNPTFSNQDKLPVCTRENQCSLSSLGKSINSLPSDKQSNCLQNNLVFSNQDKLPSFTRENQFGLSSSTKSINSLPTDKQSNFPAFCNQDKLTPCTNESQFAFSSLSFSEILSGDNSNPVTSSSDFAGLELIGDGLETNNFDNQSEDQVFASCEETDLEHNMKYSRKQRRSSNKHSVKRAKNNSLQKKGRRRSRITISDDEEDYDDNGLDLDGEFIATGKLSGEYTCSRCDCGFQNEEELDDHNETFHDSLRYNFRERRSYSAVDYLDEFEEDFD